MNQTKTMRKRTAQLSLALAACFAGAVGLRAQTVLFEDNFDTAASAAKWNLFEASLDFVPDYTAEFGFDYSQTRVPINGTLTTIPPSPNGGGTSLGVKLTVNNNDENAAASAVNLYAKDLNLSGDYSVFFDMWINYNGPAYGGTGSTEFAMFGLNFTGTQVNWAAPAAAPQPSSDGFFWAVTGEGGAAGDYRFYEGDGLGTPLRYTGAEGGMLDRDGNGQYEDEGFNQNPASYPLNFIFPSPKFETIAMPGKGWVQVELRQRDGLHTWLMNGYVIAEKPASFLWISGSPMIGTMDTFNSVASPAAENFVLFDNFRAVQGTPAKPKVSITAFNPEAFEPSSPATILITRQGDASQPLAVKLKAAGTAISGVDYQALPATVTIPAGLAELSLDITPIDDRLGEPIETILVILDADPAYEVFSPTIASINLNDDGDVTEVNLTAPESIVIEGLEAPTFVNVWRIGDTTFDLVVGLSRGGTAGAADYNSDALASVVIPAGLTNVWIPVLSTADAVADPDETIILGVVAGDGYLVGKVSPTATLTIKEATVAFTDDLNTDTSANYTTRFSAANGTADFLAQFAFDYVAAGIPPIGAASTGVGLKATANKDAVASAASVNVYPTGLNLSGDFAVRFDMFLTYNPVAAGTTESAIFGINHSGAVANRHATAGGDGLWFAVETDGSAQGGRSYVLYTGSPTAAPAINSRPASQFLGAFPAPPFLANGAASGAWVPVVVRQIGNVITWTINGTLIIQAVNTSSYTSGTLMLGHMDTFNSIGSVDNFTVFDNVKAVRVGPVEPPAPTNIQVASIAISGGNATIRFTADSGVLAKFSVEAAQTVNGPYAAAAATVVSTGANAYEATLPVSGATWFFRVKYQ